MTNAKNSAPKPQIRFIDIYKPSQQTDDYSDAYSLERGANLAYLIQKMYPDAPDHIVAGIAANALHESYGNPAVRQGQLPNATGPITGGATGLFGWDSLRAAKLRELYGQNWKSLENQLKYFQMENSGPEKKNWQRVLKAKTPEEAASTFAIYWERPGKKALPKRTGLARDLYEYIDEYKKKNAANRQDQPIAGLPQRQSPSFMDMVRMSPVIMALPALNSSIGRGVVDMFGKFGTNEP